MSRWLYMFERRALWESRRRWAIGLLAVYLVLYWLDGAIYRLLYVGRAGDGARLREVFELRSWAAMLKTAGYFPTWVIVAVLFAAAGRLVEGVRIAAGAAVAGTLAEVLKPLIGQVRPHLVDGVHRYYHVEGLHDLSFGMASSHAAVAFGAAWGLLFINRRVGWVALALAAGCGLERMMAGAHFTTDIYVGALLGYAGARLFRAGGRTGLP